ncbi:MAG: ferritin family protein [Azospirillaceae bacterium]|nr:ferritin family protein [Azospirillaceae bacterium]
MKSVEEFLAYATKLEEEATLRFDQLADAMQGYGNKDVGSLFRRLSEYSRRHLADARARSGFRDIPVMDPGAYQWPDVESPEAAAIWAADPFLAKNEALEIALASETAGYDFYKSVHDTTDDPEIRRLAAEFAAEEAEHVAWIRQWIDHESKNGGSTEATMRGIALSN